jgi:hypothetical protein
VSSWPMIIEVKSANFSNYTNSTRNYEADKWANKIICLLRSKEKLSTSLPRKT